MPHEMASRDGSGSGGQAAIREEALAGLSALGGDEWHVRKVDRIPQRVAQPVGQARERVCQRRRRKQQHAA